MPSPGTTGASESSEPARGAQGSAGQEIDLQALADKVYELLKQEARLERERLGQREDG